MSNSIFTKNKNKLFAIVMLVVVIVFLLLSVLAYFYFGKALDSNDVTTNMSDSLTLGESFSSATLFENDNYNYWWINGNNVKVEVFVGDNAEQLTTTEKILEYSQNTRTFKVVGVASGYIKFTSNVDNTVNHTIQFATKFKSKDTQSIIEQNYPEFLQDNIVDATELATVVSLIVSQDNIDMADFGSFVNLKELQIKNTATEGIFHYTNIQLPQNAKVYVMPRLYGQYVTDTESGWSSISNKIYPFVSKVSAHSVVLNKNGGTFSNDSGLNYEMLEVDDDSSIALSKDYAISRVGYHFDGWYISYDNGATLQERVTDNYVVTDDVKLYARWIPYTYKLQLYNNDGTQNYFEQNCTFDKIETIAYAPQYGNYVHVGWAFEPQATQIDFATNADIKNLSSADGGVVKLYALWSHSEIDLQLYTINQNSTEYTPFDSIITYEYGTDVTLKSSTGSSPGNTVGVYKGWSLTPQANKVEYQYGETVNTAKAQWYVLIANEPVVNVYAVYEYNAYKIKYNANIDGEAGNIDEVQAIRKEEVHLHKALDREGYRFTGWQDDLGFIWTAESIYDANRSYYDTNYADKTIKLQLDENNQFVAPSGIDTMISGEVNLVAQWQANHFSVRFEGDINEASYYEPAVLTYGQPFTFVGKLDKTGHELVSCMSSVGDINLKGATLTVEQVNQLYEALRQDTPHNQFNLSSVVVFTATWKANTHKVYFNYNNGNPGIEYKEVVYGTAYGTLPTPTREDRKADNGTYSYQFLGWTYNGKTITANTLMLVDDTHMLTAQWHETFTGECLLYGTEIMMMDGSTKEIQDIKVGDYIGAWDFAQGQFVYSQVAFIEANIDVFRKVTELQFEDGTTVSLTYEHAFFDMTLGKFVDISADNVWDFVGHDFAMLQQIDDLSFIKGTRLVSASVEERVTKSYCIVTADSINHFANGILSAGSDIEFLLNMFAIDTSTMSYDQQAMQQDIALYGLYEYDEFAQYVTYEQFMAFNGAYLKVSVGKGLITFEGILDAIALYLQ